MTRVVFYTLGGVLCGFEADGHAGYADAGEDIVCAGISAVLLTALGGLTDIAGIACRVHRRDKRGYLRVLLPEATRDAELILKVAWNGIMKIAEAHPGFVRVNVRKRRQGI